METSFDKPLVKNRDLKRDKNADLISPVIFYKKYLGTTQRPVKDNVIFSGPDPCRNTITYDQDNFEF